MGGCWRLQGASVSCEGPWSENRNYWALFVSSWIPVITKNLLYIVFANFFVFALVLVTGVTHSPCLIGCLHGFMGVSFTNHGTVEN